MRAFLCCISLPDIVGANDYFSWILYIFQPKTAQRPNLKSLNRVAEQHNTGSNWALAQILSGTIYVLAAAQIRPLALKLLWWPLYLALFKDPGNIKYRQVKLTNPKIESKLLPAAGKVWFTMTFFSFFKWIFWVF